MDHITLEIARSDETRYMAMTDGAFQPLVGTRIQEIVEVKKAIQHSIDKTITKQKFSEIMWLAKNDHLAPFNNQ